MNITTRWLAAVSAWLRRVRAAAAASAGTLFVAAGLGMLATGLWIVHPALALVVVGGIFMATGFAIANRIARANRANRQTEA